MEKLFKKEIKLKTEGPFNLVGKNNLFDVPENKLSGLYLLTFKYKDGYLVEYVGITTKRSYEIRFREHIHEILSGGYKLYDLDKLMKDEDFVVWNGRFGKEKGKTIDFLNNYKKFTSFIEKLLKSYKIFFIPTDLDQRTVERIEGAIYEIFKKKNDKKVRQFIEGVRYKARRE
ncbi:hypothetical protein KKD20_00700, partial [Patescibacteria group bacterium]|nr:hypothetical protein [Patescibacteria group bacterium]